MPSLGECSAVLQVSLLLLLFLFSGWRGWKVILFLSFFFFFFYRGEPSLSLSHTFSFSFGFRFISGGKRQSSHLASASGLDLRGVSGVPKPPPPFTSLFLGEGIVVD